MPVAPVDSRKDKFAQLLADGLTVPEIQERLRLTRGQARGLLSRIRKDLGWQAI